MRKVYELPRTQYAFLMEVKERLGWITHSAVSNALCNDSHRIDRSLLRISGEEKAIQEIAKKHSVLISFY
ncbi:hypothetical protein A2392_00815 [Candidatus Kaiserbacteria bacterium RIFOXYB1_FULL_46_14]|uniref:Uncharacterized protein n=1 Tax=Candidatus Kaiserbacteria bacterium RIFOXYB1_FULL_46_14 TaxID=1798531 RepID=A0A1F6FJF7_9BACT|nr:MAG: hypothetical protein A2392_00815 [Candidatus Kaiserbacteria bacterium RIFOXYB1_FULL_46_14]